MKALCKPGGEVPRRIDLKMGVVIVHHRILRYVVACSCYTTSTRICSKLLHGPGTPTKLSSPLQRKTKECQFEENRPHKIHWRLETSEGVTIGIESARPPVKDVFVPFTVAFLPCKLNNENPALSDRLIDDPTPLLCSSIVR